jgi:hypothetical protein
MSHAVEHCYIVNLAKLPHISIDNKKKRGKDAIVLIVVGIIIEVLGIDNDDDDDDEQTRVCHLRERSR